MSRFRAETLEGGISLMIIEGEIGKQELDLFQALSHMSKSKSHILVDLSAIDFSTDEFFEHLSQLSARTKIKVVVTKNRLITKCQAIGLATFPTIKSAALALAGDETLRLLLANLKDVPLLNTDAYELVSAISQPDCSFHKLETLIKDKPTVCAQILRLANSAYFCRARKVETLPQAFSILGTINLRQLFLYNFYSSVGNVFKAQQEVIAHGKQCALLAEYICISAGGSPEECAKCRMSGLLHDIGQQALAFFFPKQYEKVHQIMAQEKRPSHIAELLIFGIDHQKVGGLLAKLWNFPDYLENAIGDHHYLASPKWNLMTLPIFCANSFLNEKAGRVVAPYLSNLEGYFKLKNKEFPWKDVTTEFNDFLSSQQDVF